MSLFIGVVASLTATLVGLVGYPDAPHTDHTREYAPLLARFSGGDGSRHDGPLADVGASVLRWLTGRDAPELPGTPFV